MNGLKITQGQSHENPTWSGPNSELSEETGSPQRDAHSLSWHLDSHTLAEQDWTSHVTLEGCIHLMPRLFHQTKDK